MLAPTLNTDQINLYAIPKAIGIRKSTEPFLVFIVDDDSIFLKSLEHHLQQKLSHNVKIISFLNGEECMRNLYLRPDVVILDYILNGQYPTAIDGVTVLKKIKQINPEVIAIMVSGQDNIQVAIDTMKYGAYDYVIKNENGFLRVQNGVKNAIHTILLIRELRNYKRRTKAALAIIITVFFCFLALQFFFPHFSFK